MRTLDLPPPDPEARRVSDLLSQRIAARIAAAGGRIGFDAWMQAALYEPGLGYYAGGSRKFGPGGDFVTAPELSPLFGGCLAHQCAQWFEHVPARVVEFGAGSGALAADLLAELALQGVVIEEYLIVEVSADLRDRQRATLAERVPQALDRVRWLDAWPQAIDGVVLANELLDAMPARVFRLREGVVFERCVRVASVDDGVPRFDWVDVAADARFEARVRGLLAQPIDEAGEEWPDDYVGEVGEQALAWVGEASRRLRRGALLLVDYGFPRREFFHPQRNRGTLMCHYRHHAHVDPFMLPGLQDVTVHVDFTGVAEAAVDAGLELLGYTSQAHLLFGLGVLDQLARTPVDSGLRYTRQAHAVQVLVSEAEMGELFKAIAFGRGLPPDAIGFVRGDRSGAL